MTEPQTPIVPDTLAAEAPATAGDDMATEALREQVQHWQDKAYRAAAELENMRKRTQTEVAEARLYAAQSFAKDILTIADNLSRALNTEASDTTALRKGIELTATQFTTILARHGIVKTVIAIGEPLNPELHQAMTETQTTEVEPGHIYTELQAGYTLHGRLLRPALVSVGKGE
jgi:molecular chaperone GrpE